MKKVITLLLLTSMLLNVAACGGDGGSGKDTTASDSSETTTAEDSPAGYPYYSGNDLGGETFTVYNVKKDLWNMLCVIQPDEINGETINDAIYNRNEYVKQQLNFALEEINAADYATMATDLQTLVLAGDDVYDAVYMPMHLMIGGLTEGYYTCLNDVDTLHLDENWWDQVLLDATSVRGKNFFATSSAHLMGWDSLWCLFFNESMMDDLGLAYPYDLVREGKWTLDQLSTYSKAAANLNGDDSFAKNAAGNSVYGCVSFEHAVMKFLFGFDVDFVSKDSKDEPVLSCEGERFIDACQQLAGYYGREGEYLYADSDSSKDTYYQNFYENQRTLFLGAELKTAQLLRPMEQSFGIVPFPKLDEAQENYRSTAVHQCAVFTIPVTNTSPEKIGLVFDALSYESDERVLGPYFHILVEQKGLRNEESIEMLNIIKDTRSFDLGIAYQWVKNMEESLRNKLLSGSTDIVGVIDTYKNEVQDSIDKMLENMK